MPNWCNNFLTITGEEVQLNKIKYLLEETKETEQGMFITLVGLPEGITPEQHEKDWWNIHISHWGCKWDVSYEDHSALYDTIGYDNEINYGYKYYVNLFNFIKYNFVINLKIPFQFSYLAGMTMSIETAWSPPISFCEKLAVMFNVEVQIFYAEPGVGFAGLCTCSPDGTSQDDELSYMEGMYKYDNSGFWDEVESNIESELEDIDWEEEPDTDHMVQEVLQEYPYISEEDVKTLKDLITEKIQDYGEA